MSVDPMASLSPAWTPYRYGYNNPLRYIDPTEMSEEDEYRSKYTDTRRDLLGTGKSATEIIGGMFSSVEETAKDLPEFVADGTLQAVKDGIDRSKDVAELGVKVTSKSADIVSDGSTIVAAGGLVAAPFTGGSSLSLTAFALSVGTGADVTSALAKGADAAFLMDRQILFKPNLQKQS